MAKFDWTQNGKLNEYSADGGWEVVQVDDKKWEVRQNGEVLETTTSRAKAFHFAENHEDPIVRVTENEHKLLGHIIESGGSVETNKLVTAGVAGLNPMATMSRLQSLTRRKLVTTNGSVTITDAGKKSFDGFQPRVSGKRVDGSDRKSGAETIYGPRPEWAPTRPTSEAKIAARLDNAFASLRYAKFRCEEHYASARSRRKLANAVKRVQGLVEKSPSEDAVAIAAARFIDNLQVPYDEETIATLVRDNPEPEVEDEGDDE